MVEIVNSFPCPQASGMVYDYVNRQLYVCDTSSGYMSVYTRDGVFVEKWFHGLSGPNGMDIDFDDPDILWITDQSTMVKMSLSTRTVLQSWTMSYPVNGVASPPGLYLWLGLATGIHRVLKSDPTGVFINVPWSFDISAIAWDGIYLWVAGYSTQIQAVNLSDYSLVYSFTVPSPSIYALTTDGHYMWAGDGVNDTVVQFYIGKSASRNAVYHFNVVGMTRIRNLKFSGSIMTPSRNMKHKIGVEEYGGATI